MSQEYAFDGACAPGKTAWARWDTFSLGVYPLVPKADGKGTKRGRVVVRVVGWCAEPEPVYAAATRIAGELAAGTYKGPKRVRIGTA